MSRDANRCWSNWAPRNCRSRRCPAWRRRSSTACIDGLVQARHRARSRRRQAAVHAAPPRGAAAGRGRRTARTAQRSARPVPQHRARCRRPADARAAGLRAEGRRRMDRAGTHQRRQGRALRPPRGEAGRADRRAAAGDRARGDRRDADPQADALGRPRLRASRGRCTGWCCCSARTSSKAKCSACAPTAMSRGHRFHARQAGVDQRARRLRRRAARREGAGRSGRTPRAHRARSRAAAAAQAGGIARIDRRHPRGGQLPGRMAERGAVRLRGASSSPCRRKR